MSNKSLQARLMKAAKAAEAAEAAAKEKADAYEALKNEIMAKRREKIADKFLDRFHSFKIEQMTERDFNLFLRFVEFAMEEDIYRDYEAEGYDMKEIRKLPTEDRVAEPEVNISDKSGTVRETVPGDNRSAANPQNNSTYGFQASGGRIGI